MGVTKTRRIPKAPNEDSTALVGELVALIKDLTTQQNRVLETAMEAQRANADVLSKWMGMFQPAAGAPTPSTSEDDRIRMREAASDSHDWEPFTGPSFDDLMAKI